MAIQVAGDAAGEYPDGVWWLDLTALTDAALAPLALARTLGLQEVPGPDGAATLLANYLRPRRLLLVLDNCEHLILALCAVSRRSCWAPARGLTILATSREPLGIGGETVLAGAAHGRCPTQQMLDSPTALIEIESVRLFWERARAVSPHFALTAPRRAQRGPDLPRAGRPAPGHRAGGGPRQAALSGTDRGAPRRSLRPADRREPPGRAEAADLRAAIDWSYDLLDEAERAMLRRLSVFDGGFTLEAAEAIWRDVAGRAFGAGAC